MKNKTGWKILAFLIVFVNWDMSHIQFLVNESATKANIRDAIQWMVNEASTGDTCLFYFSGHGDSIIDYSGDEADGF